MSPLQIEILLQTFYSPSGYNGPSVGSPAHCEFMQEFVRNGVIDTHGGITEVGRSLIERLCAVPMVQP